MSTLMFWNKQNTANNQNSSDGKNSKRNWLHAPDVLLNGHVVYLVKFLGNTPVDQPKGIEVVKDAIRRLQFNQQMKKAETGNAAKLKKVEITISVDGVAIQEPRTRKVLYQYPLHNISYCADEKGVKKFFSFIAKQPIVQNGSASNGKELNGYDVKNVNGTNPDEKHECFVFVSSKLASDITLTIGQAFDLAYRRYMEENGKSTELTKAQQQTKQLEKTVTIYKDRLKQLSDMLPKSEIDKMLSRLGIQDLFELPPEDNIIEENLLNGTNKNITAENQNDEKLLIETGSNKSAFAPIIPPRQLQNQLNNKLDAFKPSGQKMDELLLNSDSDSDFDPRADESDNGNKITNDLFGFEPKSFGQQLFNNSSNGNISNQNNSTGSLNYSNSNGNLNGFVNGMTNGVNSVSPPPLLAPPPKAAVPRRSTSVNNTNNTNGFMNGNQDLFGSIPFNPNTPSIFDNKFGENTYDLKNANNASSSDLTLSLNAFPALQLNSTGIDDSIGPADSSFSLAFSNVSNKSSIGSNLSNPFIESGIYEMNINSNESVGGTTTSNDITTDLNAFANNSSKLDTALKSDDNQYIKSNQETINKTFVNNNAGGGGGGGFTLSNPFTKKASEVLLNPRRSNMIASSNYDALRNSPDFDFNDSNMNTTTNLSSNQMNTISNPITINKNNDNFLGVNNQYTFGGGGSGMTSEASSAGPNSAASSYDIFKDAAAKAFSELSPSGRTGASFPMKISNTNQNEFSNRMSGLNLNG